MTVTKFPQNYPTAVDELSEANLTDAYEKYHNYIITGMTPLMRN